MAHGHDGCDDECLIPQLCHQDLHSTHAGLHVQAAERRSQETFPCPITAAGCSTLCLDVLFARW